MLRLTVLLTVALSLAGCGSEPVTGPDPTDTAAPPASPAEELLGRVAAAKDARYQASYTLRTKGRSDRTVRVRLASDGSWRFDVPGGARGGGTDVAIAGTKRGVYQCSLRPKRGCVKVAAPGKRVPSAYDPLVQLPFTSWLDVLGDTRAPLSVARDTTLKVPTGKCYSVEPNAAAMTPPIAAGIYCFDTDGVLTGARFWGRTLVISGGPSKPAKTVKLPGPVTDAKPLPTKSPPKPSKSPSASPSKTAGQ